MISSDVENEKTNPSSSDGSPENRVAARVYEMRIGVLNEKMTEYRASLIEAKVVFDEKFQDEERRIQDLYARICVAVEIHFETCLRGFEFHELPPETQKRHRDDLYNASSHEKSDDFKSELDSVITAFERLLTAK